MSMNDEVSKEVVGPRQDAARAGVEPDLVWLVPLRALILWLVNAITMIRSHANNVRNITVTNIDIIINYSGVEPDLPAALALVEAHLYTVCYLYIYIYA